MFLELVKNFISKYAGYILAYFAGMQMPNPIGIACLIALVVLLVKNR